ncbi:MAG TPA: OsmC family peroxiredoxin [Anaerolineales bacterium]|nr:OsmC family peroxiredoxin [Anaerolineales bacterium]
MSIRNAEATWIGSLKEGQGNMKAGSGAFDLPFTWGTRFGDDPGTNPEELIGAAQAGCFTMFLSARLTAAGFVPDELHTRAAVYLGSDDIGPLIEKIELTLTARVPGISREKFDEEVAVSKKNCPISRALANIEEFEVHATLLTHL